ncbi:MAG: FAD-binding protein, partial [Woeseiaceae bacterium]
MSAGGNTLVPVSRSDLLRRLLRHLPPEAVVEDRESQRPFECDALTLYRELPLLVVLPETVDQVQTILRECHALGVPVVARGSGTGLCAGSMPHPEGVLLGLSRLDRILEIDPLART